MIELMLPIANSLIMGINETKTAEQRREKILQLESVMKTMDSVLDQCMVRHIFAPGLYAREMTIPKGTVIIGKIHKHSHVNTISQGRCSVETEFGQHEIIAPYTFVSEIGTKRIVVALEEVIWTTYHPSNETDLVKLENEIIAKDYLELSMSSTILNIEGDML